MRTWRKRKKALLLLTVALACVLYCEKLCYTVATLGWPRMDCPRGSSCVRLMMVADPQILSPAQNGNPLLGWISRLDSVSFLSETYRRARDHFLPDAVLFLGDETDDGRLSSDDLFQKDVDTFDRIFRAPMRFIIAGDNDVGGEAEPLYPKAINRFARAFPHPQCVDVRGVVVCEANGLLQRRPTHPLSVSEPPIVKILVSHPPLLEAPTSFARDLLDRLEPSVIFSGHRHAAYHTTATRDGASAASAPPRNDTLTRIRFEPGVYHEFVVPTCSYRMGEEDTGYGVAVIEKSKGLTYTILWSPRRFDQLKLYLAVIGIMFVYAILTLLMKISNHLFRLTRKIDLCPITC